jgi:cysteine desulfurase/selenocysteine lyase
MTAEQDGANFAESTDAVFDPYRAREDFPALDQLVHGKPLVYLDNAATTHKPQAVIDATVQYYSKDNSNVHRGLHTLSERATRDYEGARDKVQKFMNASSRGEVLYTRGTTDGINLVAQSYARPRLKPGDEIIISHMEHHSNIVPWQLVCEQTGANLKVVPINDQGELDFEAYLDLLSPRTRLVAMVHLSNSLGTINPIGKVIEAAHAQDVKVLVDGAQAFSRLSVDVQALDCDFYAVSGHKIYGPTGIGALYGRESLLDEMVPYQGGGDMIRTVTFEETTYNALPYKFEAGTPNIAGAVGLGAAVDYLTGHGVDAVDDHERVILDYATQAVTDITGLTIIGTAKDKAGVLAFVLDGAHAHDIGTILDTQGVAVRAGHHCTMPLMERFDVPATARASFGLYNTREDVDALVAGLKKTIDIFSG